MTKYPDAVKQLSVPVHQSATLEQDVPSTTSQTTQLIITVACLSFFPLMYVVGKAVISLLT